MTKPQAELMEKLGMTRKMKALHAAIGLGIGAHVAHEVYKKHKRHQEKMKKTASRALEMTAGVIEKAKPERWLDDLVEMGYVLDRRKRAREEAQLKDRSLPKPPFIKKRPTITPIHNSVNWKKEP